MNKDNLIRVVMLSFVICFISYSTYAQRVEVRKSGSQKISINLQNFYSSGFSEADEFLRTLKNDLERSGWFKLNTRGSEITINGSLKKNPEGLRVEFHIIQTESKKKLFSRALSGPNNSSRILAHRTSDTIVKIVTGNPGMASSKLAIVGNQTGSKELYVCDIDGANIRQITSDKSIVVAPAWMPDGRNILYTSYKAGYPNIYQTGISGALSSYGGLNASASVSPDGRYIALILSKDGNPELYVKEIKTGRAQRMTFTRRANEASPCWSPDGTQLAYVSDSSGRPHIYVINLKGGQPKKISSSGSENVAPDWGLNGITYCSRQGGRYRIMVVNPKNKDTKMLKLDNADYEDPCWAVDNRHIIASRSVNYQSSIYLLDTIEDPPIPLVLQKNGDWFSPACTR